MVVFLYRSAKTPPKVIIINLGTVAAIKINPNDPAEPNTVTAYHVVVVKNTLNPSTANIPAMIKRLNVRLRNKESFFVIVTLLYNKTIPNGRFSF